MFNGKKTSSEKIKRESGNFEEYERKMATEMV